MADYVLPDLPYDYGALAPHISGEIMELHHDKHHATYVKGLNTALEQLAEARDSDSFGSVGGLERFADPPICVSDTFVTEAPRTTASGESYGRSTPP